MNVFYDDETIPQWLRQIPVVDILRQTLIYQYYVENNRVCWRTAAPMDRSTDHTTCRTTGEGPRYTTPLCLARTCNGLQLFVGQLAFPGAFETTEPPLLNFICG
ncbi:MAG: hypothetical protein KME46_32890, partial [Brasilonema angustatum HA4187-MV1]|nr:hypothetical protein [Brasilonema angustatum HA4187-MV1]